MTENFLKNFNVKMFCQKSADAIFHIMPRHNSANTANTWAKKWSHPLLVLLVLRSCHTL